MVAKALRRNDIHVWSDREIQPGESPANCLPAKSGFAPWATSPSILSMTLQQPRRVGRPASVTEATNLQARPMVRGHEYRTALAVLTRQSVM
jgi:hypothetical protein